MNNFDLNNYLNTFLANEKKNNSLYGPYTGFIKGNLFSNLYMPYLNYKENKLIPKNEYEEDLLNLNQFQFACHELNLLLDNYPNDTEIIKLYNKYKENFLNLLTTFEKKYGPISVMSNDLENTLWEWDNKPWPWEGDAN